MRVGIIDVKIMVRSFLFVLNERFAAASCGSTTVRGKACRTC
jgi:hypothetical protein